MATVATTSPKPPRSATAGPDGITVAFLTLAAFLAVLAVLAWQVRSTPARRAHRVVVLRRVYETRVVETVPGRGTSTVSQSVSSSGAASSLSSTPTTRSS
jgi:hypothetical protein